MENKDFKKFKLPSEPGVYLFKVGRDILYIGKATNLKDRVKSYFNKELINMRGMFLVDMVTKANKIDFIKTDSVLEALILEANLIKKHQPKYNTKEKDNKSFNYVCITGEKIPKVLVVRGRAIDFKKLTAGSYKLKAIFGPFTNGLQLREAMKIIRRIFPYFDEQSSKKQNYEFYKQLALIPDKDYKNNIKNLILFFEGKKKKIIQNLKKEMTMHAKKKEFEQAGEIKKKIFALNHINDVALIKEKYPLRHSDTSPLLRGRPGRGIRIEAYDIAHMSGKNMVGVMTVVLNNEIERNEYKKFIIKTQENANDTGALEEVLSRRFRHVEWGLPNLVVVDGSTAQINVAKKVLNRYQFKIPVVAVVKDDKHKAKAILGDETLIKQHKKSILLANNEAHRFAIGFYRQKSRKNIFSTL